MLNSRFGVVFPRKHASILLLHDHATFNARRHTQQERGKNTPSAPTPGEGPACMKYLRKDGSVSAIKIVAKTKLLPLSKLCISPAFFVQYHQYIFLSVSHCFLRLPFDLATQKKIASKKGASFLSVQKFPLRHANQEKKKNTSCSPVR